jgi:hypothetical protein
LHSWLRGYSKFLAGWKVRYESKNDNKFPFADVLEDLHSKKLAFRIECLWDDGFKAILVNKDVSPSRLQVDEHNDRQPGGDADTLLEVPEVDWVKKFHENKVEDTVKQLVYYLKNGRAKQKLSPAFLERRRKEIMRIINEVRKKVNDADVLEREG